MRSWTVLGVMLLAVTFANGNNDTCTAAKKDFETAVAAYGACIKGKNTTEICTCKTEFQGYDSTWANYSTVCTGILPDAEIEKATSEWETAGKAWLGDCAKDCSAAVTDESAKLDKINTCINDKKDQMCDCMDDYIAYSSSFNSFASQCKAWLPETVSYRQKLFDDSVASWNKKCKLACTDAAKAFGTGVTAYSACIGDGKNTTVVCNCKKEFKAYDSTWATYDTQCTGVLNKTITDKAAGSWQQAGMLWVESCATKCYNATTDHDTKQAAYNKCKGTKTGDGICVCKDAYNAYAAAFKTQNTECKDYTPESMKKAQAVFDEDAKAWDKNCKGMVLGIFVALLLLFI